MVPDSATLVAEAQTLVPPSGLATPGTKDTDPPLFCLFTRDWLKLQTFIVQALQLPITQGDFVSKYGKFQDEQQIKDVITAMQGVQGLSTTFGDPILLLKQLETNPAILQGDTAPKELYTHIVWFANQLYQTARTFNQTLGQFITILNPANCGNKAQCGALLISLLTGPGGLQSSAASMVTLANALVSKLAAFNNELTPKADTMATYVASSGTFYQDVEKAITADLQDIANYQKAADTAYKLWEDLTIAACTTSVGVLVLTGGAGILISGALATGLGVEAQKARDAYNQACDDLHKAETDEQKKINLKADLDTFNKTLSPVNDAAQNFLTTLQKVAGVWSQISNNLSYIATHFTPEQVGDLGWLQQAMALDRATQDWGIIATAAEGYTSNSLVSYKIQPFGTPSPQ